MKLLSFVLGFSLLVTGHSQALALEAPFDHSAFDSFLKKFVNEDGLVNYAEAQKDRALLDEYLLGIGQIREKDFDSNWPREEKLALWLNAFHAGLVRAVLNHYPIRSVNDIPGIWDIADIHVAGKNYSLNQIRSKQLLKTFRDEKIHLSLGCGSIGCPKFPREAFTGPKVEGQMFLMVRQFVNDAHKNQITPGKKKIYISPIFKWYGADFTLDFGDPERNFKYSPYEYAILSFLANYLEDAAKIDYLEKRNYKIKYLRFEWALNDWKPALSSPKS